jgi:tRNA(Ile)-lysidine synthase
MRQLDDILSTEVQQILPGMLGRDEEGELSLIITKLRSKPEYLQEEIILEVLRFLGSEIESEKVLKILELTGLTTGSQLQLSKSLHVYRNRDRLIFVRPREEPDLHQALNLGRTYNVQDFNISLSMPLPRPSSMGLTKSVEFVDARKLGSRLLLRSWQDGDWFIPLGMKAKKKVSDFFVDEKVSLLQKRRIPILESDGEIVWICGRRLDERFKVTEQTQQVVKLEFVYTIFSH